VAVVESASTNVFELPVKNVAVGIFVNTDTVERHVNYAVVGVSASTIMSGILA
jgi:hypothetical protein